MKVTDKQKLNSGEKKVRYNTFQRSEVTSQEEREHFIPIEDSDEEADLDTLKEVTEEGQTKEEDRVRLEVAEEEVIKVRGGRLIKFKKMVLKTPKHNEKFDAFALRLGKLGFFARGFVWACVGGVAISAAFTGERTQGTSGALSVVAARTGGAVVLIIATLGLLCYAAWRYFEGIYGLRIDPNAGKFGKIVNGYVTPFASGTAYLIFAATNIKTIRDGFKQNSENSTLEKMADHVGGKIVLTIAGVVLIGVGLNWLWDLVKQKYKAEMNQEAVEKHTPVKLVVYTSAYLGWFGRAVLFNLLGVELIRVCYSDDTPTGGFGAALGQLQLNVAGRIFLIFVGVCLVIFGLFSITQAKYKRFLMYKPHLVDAKTKSSAVKSIRGRFNKPQTEEEAAMDHEERDRKRKQNRTLAKQHYNMANRSVSEEDTKVTTPLMEKKSKPKKEETSDELPPV